MNRRTLITRFMGVAGLGFMPAIKSRRAATPQDFALCPCGSRMIAPPDADDLVREGFNVQCCKSCSYAVVFKPGLLEAIEHQHRSSHDTA